MTHAMTFPARRLHRLHRLDRSSALLALGLTAACAGGTEPPAGGGTGGSESLSGISEAGTASGGATAGTATTLFDEERLDVGDGKPVPDLPLCGEVSFTLDAVPPNVMLVLDKSGSMISNSWDHDADAGTPDITRWHSLYNVVEFIVASFDEQINFGANLFPSNDAEAAASTLACIVESTPEVPVARRNGQAVLAGIPTATATDLAGATPAAAGITAAVTHLKSLERTIPRAMILITDGAANCGAGLACTYPDACPLLESYDDALPEAVLAAYEDARIPTYVVGIDIIDALAGTGDDGAPEANAFAELNLVAENGGVGRSGSEKFYNATNEIELRAALEAISADVVNCVVPLSEIPDYPGGVEVSVGGEAVTKIEDCATGDGWVYTNPSGPYDAVELCNAACDRFAEIGDLDAKFLCPGPV